MTTKFAIELLTQSQNDLTIFLSGLGLLENESNLSELKNKFEAAFQEFLTQYDVLKKEVAVTTSQVDLLKAQIDLGMESEEVREDRLERLSLEKRQLANQLDILAQYKASLENYSNSEEQTITNNIEAIKQDIFETEKILATRRQQISDKEVLISTYQAQIDDLRQQETHHNSLAEKYDSESRIIKKGRSGKKKTIIDQDKVALREQEYEKANLAAQQADELVSQIETVQTEIEELNPFIDILEKELLGHVLRLDSQKDLLSLNALDLPQKLEQVELQIQQQSEDLSHLETEIIEQETLVNQAENKLSDLRTELDKLEASKTITEEELRNFETTYEVLLSEDVSDFLDWQVDENTSDVIKLRQQILGLEKLENVETRLDSLQSQESLEEAVNLTVTADNIESYITLNEQLTQDIQELSTIWASNLKESHNLTFDIVNLTQQRSQSINNFVNYIEENLADSQGNYWLEQIQLQEALKLQSAQVEYKDALVQSVDGLEEAIAVLELQVKQSEILAKNIENLNNFNQLEREYATLELIKAKFNEIVELAGSSDPKIYNRMVGFIKVLESSDLVSSEQISTLQGYLESYKAVIDSKNNQLLTIHKQENELTNIAKSNSAFFNSETENWYFLSTPGTWFSAQDEAVNNQGNLVTINNAEEQEWIHSHFQGEYWIGLSDQNQEGKWEWVSGENSSYYNWNKGEPNNEGNEDFVHTYSSGKWNDNQHNEQTISGIIELNFQQFEQQREQIELKITEQLKEKVFTPFQSLFLSDIENLVDDSAASTRPLLINYLSEEILDKNQNLTTEIDLSNEQQEQWLETNLLKYFQKKHSQIIATKEEQLSLINQTVLPSSALYFDGVDDYVNVGGKSNLEITNALTLEAWIKPQRQDGYGILVGREGEYLLAISKDNKISYALANSNPGWKWVSTNYTISLEEWTHIALTYNSEEIKLYRNGELVYNQNGAGILKDSYTKLEGLRIGNRQHSRYPDYFKGAIDDVRVWNIARTQAEIKKSFNHQLSGKETGLVNYLNFEEVSKNTVLDLTKNSNSGTLNNGVQRIINNSDLISQIVHNLSSSVEEQAISDLQNLRVETAYLTLQAETNPDKLQDFLQEYLDSEKTETDINTIIEKYYPELSDATSLANLRQEINNELTTPQEEYQALKAEINEKQANATAALSQADWYEQQAQIHWELSKKQGATWTETRSYKQKKCGNVSHKNITVTHVDHDWIIWDTYTKQAANLREYATNLDQEVSTDTEQQDVTSSLVSQWQQASSAADQAEHTLDQFIAELEKLEAQRELLPEQEAQLENFQSLLPTLKEQLKTAQTAAEQAKANTLKAQQEFDTSSQAYETALTDVLAQKATVDSNAQNLLQQIANSRAWVEQQTLALDTEISETLALQQQLQEQLNQLPTTGNENLEKSAQIQQSINLLTHKHAVLTAQQASLTQQLTLIDAQQDVVEAEQKLLLATLESPDNDFSNLEDQLEDAQKILKEIQTLAQQAEASSIALSTSLETLQSFLELQNDQYLDEIKAKQATLQEIIDTIELRENYTLQATEKQLELNTLETQLLTRLQEATDAGSEEAKHLLEVAQYNNFETAAEIYYKDYRDLMTDKGGGCAGGIAKPEDAEKADYYYQEMLKYRQLKEQAQQQANQFTHLKNASESQIDLIKQQQAIAEQDYQELQSNLNQTQGNLDELEKQLNNAEIRLDALNYFRNWTEQTLVQLLQVEQLNLGQAELEQLFAQQRQLGIDETITAQFERQRAEIERNRAIAMAKIEQLTQLQAEDALQQALNDLKLELGEQPIETVNLDPEYQAQMTQLLDEVAVLEQTSPNLPDNIQTLLAQTKAEIEDALQGKEVSVIQDNLLKNAEALLGEASQLQLEILKLSTEEEQLNNILIQSQTDLQGAAKALYDEIQKAEALGEEIEGVNQGYLETLYQVGYAQGATDLSNELAKQSKDIINQIIKGRIEERKVRQKAFVNELLGTITLVLNVIAAVATAGASLIAGSLVQPSIAMTLTTISSAVSATQAAYNGDWQNAIFNAGRERRKNVALT